MHQFFLLPMESMAGAVQFACYLLTMLVAVFSYLMCRQ